MFDGLLFDLDGTLWDSVDSICLSWNRVLERIAPQYAGQITRPRLIGCMGMLLPDIVKKLLPDLDWKEIQPLLDGLLKEENAHVARHGGILYPQVPETLEILARDYPLFIVSNCNAEYIPCFLDAHQLHRYFQDWECIGRTGKQKWENIRLVVERNHLQRPVYVGDTAMDQEAAQKAGVPFLHAAYGFGDVTGAPEISQFPQLLELLQD